MIWKITRLNEPRPPQHWNISSKTLEVLNNRFLYVNQFPNCIIKAIIRSSWNLSFRAKMKSMYSLLQILFFLVLLYFQQISIKEVDGGTTLCNIIIVAKPWLYNSQCYHIPTTLEISPTEIEFSTSSCNNSPSK